MRDERDILRSALADRYEVVRPLGEGAMGTVLLGRDLKHNRQVAIKVLKPELAGAAGEARFQREIEAIAALRHPHILPLLDSGHEDGVHYFITPYVDGETLKARLEREVQLPLEDVVSIASDVAEGLAHAHSLGLVHRDVKPGNIMLSEGHALITDFGLARAMIQPEDGRVSSSGMMIGTPLYMSPEQASGEPSIDGRADVYSLGCVVFEMLAGDPPFTAKRVQALIAKHVMEPVSDLTVSRPSVPDPMARAVERALSKAPADRFPTATDFSRALAEGRSAAAGARPGREAASRAGWVVAAAMLVVVAIAIARAGSGPAAVEGARSFLVVGSQAGGTSSDGESAVVRASEAALTGLLSGWEGVEVVQDAERAGLRADLGLDRDVSPSVDDGLAMADRAGVATLVSFEQRLVGDSLFVEGRRYDVASGRPVGSPMSASGSRADLAGLMAPLAVEALGLPVRPARLMGLREESRSLAAVLSALEAEAQLRQWGLEPAERGFRAALAVDSAFGRAHYGLATTLFWQGATDPNRFPDLGGEIRRRATAARSASTAMQPRDSLAVAAFFDFVNGRYQEARTGYTALVEADSTDVEAWLYLGAVEYWDPWAVEAPDGSMRPRGSFNRATEAFLTAIRISPDFFLGFGHLFDVYRRVADAAGSGLCYNYPPLRDEVVMPWESSTSSARESWCPVVTDTIRFLGREALDTIPSPTRLDGAERFLDRSLVELRRWAGYAPDNPWPQKALARWALARAYLRLERGSTSPWPDLLAEAKEYAERGLALSSDTTPEDLVQVANLRLAVGELHSALDLVDRALNLAAASGRVLPREAANVLMAAGRVRAAADLAEADVSSVMTVRDDRGNRLDVLVLPLLERMRVLGATGGGAGAALEALRSIEAAWTSAGYTPEQQRRIKAAMTPRVRVALAVDDDARDRWFADWQPPDPALLGLLLAETDPSRAGSLLSEAFAEMRAGTRNRREPFTVALLAQALGAHEHAITALGSIASARARIDGLDDGWGMGSVSHLLIGRSHEALGDSTRAINAYEQFADHWVGADDLGAVLRAEALAGIARLRAP